MSSENDVRAVRFRLATGVIIGVFGMLSIVFFEVSSATGVYTGRQSAGRQRDTSSPKEYCEWERFQANCSRGEVVVMRSAIYGRMRIGKCVEAGLGFLGCSADVLRLADAKCSGRQSCDIAIPDKDFDSTKPCYKELKVYLEASYICMRVADADISCTVQLSSTGSTGQASYVVASTRVPSLPVGGPRGAHQCGTQTHPWIVEAESGQRVNVSLIDFATAPSPAGSPSTTDDDRLDSGADRSRSVADELLEDSCPTTYGFLLERGDTQRTTNRRNATLCGGGRRREREVYQTDGHVVHMVTSSLDDGDAADDDGVGTARYFIVRFEAVGCADLKPPQDSWLKRSGDDLVVGCHVTSQTWHLKCIGRRWFGVIGNCTSNVANARKEALVNGYEITFPHLLTFAAVVVISLSMSFVIVCVGVICFRRFAQQERQRKQQYAAIQAEKLYNDVTSTIDGSSMSPYGKTISGSTMTSEASRPAHIWQLPLPPPGGDTFSTTRCHQKLQHGVAAMKVETDYSVGSVDSRYFVLDHGQHGNASTLGFHDSNQ